MLRGFLTELGNSLEMHVLGFMPDVYVFFSIFLILFYFLREIPWAYCRSAIRFLTFGTNKLI